MTDLQTGCSANLEVFRGANSELQYKVTPILRADSTVESLPGHMKDIMSGILQQLQNCPAQWYRMHVAVYHLNVHNGKTHFKRWKVPGAALSFMRERSAVKPHMPFSADNLSQGSWGAVVPRCVDLDTPAMQEDVPRIIAVTAYLQNAPAP